jgi:hypothetical protein
MRYELGVFWIVIATSFIPERRREVGNAQSGLQLNLFLTAQKRGFRSVADTRANRQVAP